MKNRSRTQSSRLIDGSGASQSTLMSDSEIWEDAELSKPRRMLFVEDKPGQLLGIQTLLSNALPTWQVETARTVHEAIGFLANETDKIYPSFDIVSIDLGLDDQPDKPVRGLELLRRIRNMYDGLPIVVHSIAVPPDPDTLREVLANQASYIYLLDAGDARGYIYMLPRLIQGFVVFSAKPAALIPRVVSMRPNPFPKPEYWETLALLARPELTYREIGSRLNVVENTIKGRVNRMARTLEDLGILDHFDPEFGADQVDAADSDDDKRIERLRPILVKWYHENKSRYDLY